MIPPAAPDLLNQNPHFASFHKTLHSKYLDSDASTRRLNIDQENTIVKLDQQRVSLAKDRILLSAIKQAEHHPSHSEPASSSASSSTQPQRTRIDFPSPFLDLLALIIPYITHSPTLTSEEHSLLHPELTLFRTQHLPSLSTILSTHLIAQHNRLCAATDSTLSAITPTDHSHSHSHSHDHDPDHNPPLMGSNPNLSSQIHRLTTHHRSLLQVQLREALLQLTHSTISNLGALTHRLTTEQLPWLESYVHGAETRFLLARAAFGAAVAKALSAKVRVTALEAERDFGTSDGGVGEEEDEEDEENEEEDGAGRKRRRRRGLGLEDTLRHLDAEEKELRERESVLKSVLSEFEDAETEAGVPGVLKRLGRRYGEVEREQEEVRADVERLRAELDGRKASTRRHGNHSW